MSCALKACILRSLLTCKYHAKAHWEPLWQILLHVFQFKQLLCSTQLDANAITMRYAWSYRSCNTALKSACQDIPAQTMTKDQQKNCLRIFCMSLVLIAGKNEDAIWCHVDSISEAHYQALPEEALQLWGKILGPAFTHTPSDLNQYNHRAAGQLNERNWVILPLWKIRFPLQVHANQAVLYHTPVVRLCDYIALL